MEAHLEKLKEIAEDYQRNSLNNDIRRKEWISHAPAVKGMLEKVSKFFNENDTYFKANIYIREYKQVGSLKGISLYSGNQATLLGTEEGFQIHFTPTPNGRINVQVSGFKPSYKDSESHQLELVNNPFELTQDKVLQLVVRGMEWAKNTSSVFSK